MSMWKTISSPFHHGPEPAKAEQEPLLQKPQPVPGRPETAASRRGVKFHAQSVVTLVAVPWAVFVLVVSSVVLLYSPHPILVHFINFVAFVFAGLLIVVYFVQPGAGVMYLWMGALSVVAAVNGNIFGHTVNDTHMSRYYSYHYRPTYTNTLPTELADAVKDAGVIGFSEDTFLDHQRIVGFKRDGHTYCVAPVLDATQSQVVQFWAVGQDCCESRWGFVCDDAKKVGAKTGVVIPEVGPSGYASWLWSQYSLAANQSAAYYGISTPASPVFVRWVQDAETVENEAFYAGLISLVLSIVIYGVVSAVLAALLHWSTSPQQAK